jgi:hypothetical protein
MLCKSGHTRDLSSRGARRRVKNEHACREREGGRELERKREREGAGRRERVANN